VKLLSWTHKVKDDSILINQRQSLEFNLAPDQKQHVRPLSQYVMHDDKSEGILQMSEVGSQMDGLSDDSASETESELSERETCVRELLQETPLSL
jgi:hypothetical protein